jgi:hypothetical protein
VTAIDQFVKGVLELLEVGFAEAGCPLNDDQLAFLEATRTGYATALEAAVSSC